MHYIARDHDHQLIDHTLSDDMLTTRLAAFQFQMKAAYQVAHQRGDNYPCALDYPEVSFGEVTTAQYQRAQAKDWAHFQRLLVSDSK